MYIHAYTLLTLKRGPANAPAFTNIATSAFATLRADHVTGLRALLFLAFEGALPSSTQRLRPAHVCEEIEDYSTLRLCSRRARQAARPRRHESQLVPQPVQQQRHGRQIRPRRGGWAGRVRRWAGCGSRGSGSGRLKEWETQEAAAKERQDGK